MKSLKSYRRASAFGIGAMTSGGRATDRPWRRAAQPSMARQCTVRSGRRTAGLLLLVLMLVADCTTPEARNERLVRFVDELIFGGPFDAHHEQDKRIARWQGKMRVAITGPGAEDYRTTLAEQVAGMAALSGLDARMAAPPCR